MIAPVRSAPTGTRGWGSWALLGAAGALFGYLADFPHDLGVLVAVGGIVLGGILQRVPPPTAARAWAPVPVLIGLAVVAVGSPLGLLPELLAGLSGIGVLVWLADDLDRPAGGISRAQLEIGIPALALGIAWASALLLPSASAPLGVAVGLLVFAIVAVAALFGEPSAFDREEPSSS
jgi:hypothetical protein